LPLQRLYFWEATAPEHVHMTQPFGGGQLRHYTWRETADEARRVATFLTQQNWPPGSRVAILGKNSAAWLIADLAVWMAGHVSVPIYPLLAAQNVAQIIEHSGTVGCLIGKLDDATILAGVPDSVFTMALPLASEVVLQRCSSRWNDVIQRCTPLPGHPVRVGSELATLMYTSGTTGQSKGVMHSFDTLTVGSVNMLADFAMSTDDRLISYLPLAHIVERSYIEMGSLHAGAHIYFTESPASFMDDLRRARPTLFGSVPRLWLKFQQGVLAQMPAHRLARLLKIPLVGAFVRRRIVRGLGLDALRSMALTGAAPTPASLMHWFSTIGLPIGEAYGMTELGVSHSTAPGDVKIGAVGVPVRGVQHRIDPDSKEVQILSPGATLGYYQEPGMTADLFTADGWLRTGDQGAIDAQNRLSIVGRIKDNFKSSKGKYIAPGPIEGKLAQHLMAEACVVLGTHLAQPLGIVLLNDATLATLPTAKASIEGAFERHLADVNASLDPHERLAHIVLATTPWTSQNGLLTPTLKVRRAVLESLFAQRAESWAEDRSQIVWVE